MAYCIDGKALAQKFIDDIAAQNAAYCAAQRAAYPARIPPRLAIIYAGDNPASQSYISAKQKALKKVGMECMVYRFPQSAAQETIIETLTMLNNTPDIQGILIQQPLPAHIDVHTLTELINPLKDVDGCTPVHLGKLFAGSSGTAGFIPCTAQAVMYVLQQARISASGAHAVIVGRSLLVGKPLAALLTHADATVTVCHSKTGNLAQITRNADILITAAGCPALITDTMIKKGAAIIDVGINRIADTSAACGYRITGDVDFESVEKKAGLITPVPGGIGPLTVAML